MLFVFGEGYRIDLAAAVRSHAWAARTVCNIKGNISAGGERIYHQLGSRDYERIRINDRADERMFCSEDEAKAAGWRGSRG